MTSILKLRELMIFMHHHNEEDAWWNNIPYEIECKGEIAEKTRHHSFLFWL